MTPNEIEDELHRRGYNWSRHPGVKKIIESAVRRHGIQSSYELDVLITLFLTEGLIPTRKDLEERADQAAEEIYIESGFSRDPEPEEIARRVILNGLDKIDQTAKLAVGCLFGELDGDQDVEEYIQLRAAEYVHVQKVMTEFFKRRESDDGR